VDPHLGSQELVAVAVVAVGVGVERVGDRTAVRDLGHRGEHLRGQQQVEEGVDE
jgi:hypothetical protein